MSQKGEGVAGEGLLEAYALAPHPSRMSLRFMLATLSP
jgi:hypothetical protein